MYNNYYNCVSVLTYTNTHHWNYEMLVFINKTVSLHVKLH